MPYVTSIERLAKEEGRNEGQAEGMAKGMAEAMVRLIRRRWKTLAPEVEQRLRALPLPQLENLAEAVSDFHSTVELEAWLAIIDARTV